MKTGANKKWWVCLPLVMLMTGMLASAEPQSLRSNLVGMWSDPAPTALDQFCFFACTDAGLGRLNGLLDDPANDARPYSALSSEAKAYEREYNRLRLTDAALETYPLDVADDPGFRRCEPWGLARQMFAPHQLEIRQRGNGRLELHYGEWDARRTIHLNGTIKTPHAHHSFSAVYDADRVITVVGVVTQFRFVNPHAMMFMDVTDDAGKVAKWTVEFAGVLNLSEAGWTAESIKAKERVTVTGNPTHTGSERMSFLKLVRSDGSQLLPGGAQRLKTIEEERRQRALQRPQQK